ncbi:MAG TPA: hypothetical protein PKY82_02315 [Pyrinomonadaceae bacterium]|nr:hypothetical protein [Pyrinomonadaceae bacterium]
MGSEYKLHCNDCRATMTGENKMGDEIVEGIFRYFEEIKNFIFLMKKNDFPIFLEFEDGYARNACYFLIEHEKHDLIIKGDGYFWKVADLSKRPQIHSSPLPDLIDQ